MRQQGRRLRAGASFVGGGSVRGRRHGDADRIVHPSNAEKIIKAQAKIGDSVERAKARSSAGRTYSRAVTRDKTGSSVVEQWLVHGSGHAWSGGSADGTYTDPLGPDASREILRFFLTELAPADR
ncbi:MAG: hypothetical protein WA441_04045 [Methyloceanibacter sp.]